VLQIEISDSYYRCDGEEMPGSIDRLSGEELGHNCAVLVAHCKAVEFSLRSQKSITPHKRDAFLGKKFPATTSGIGLHDFRTATSTHFVVIFFLTSIFINSIHQLVAVEDHCKFSMKNGRENRNNGNQEEGEKEKETLREAQ